MSHISVQGIDLGYGFFWKDNDPPAHLSDFTFVYCASPDDYPPPSDKEIAVKLLNRVGDYNTLSGMILDIIQTKMGLFPGQYGFTVRFDGARGSIEWRDIRQLSQEAFEYKLDEVMEAKRNNVAGAWGQFQVKVVPSRAPGWGELEA